MAVMGPSGSGKTYTLDILSGRRTGNNVTFITIYLGQLTQVTTFSSCVTGHLLAIFTYNGFHLHFRDFAQKNQRWLQKLNAFFKV